MQFTSPSGEVYSSKSFYSQPSDPSILPVLINQHEIVEVTDEWRERFQKFKMLWFETAYGGFSEMMSVDCC